MSVETRSFKIQTKGFCDIHDITSQVAEIVQNSPISNGHVLVFIGGSTASITTIEYESGVVQDLSEAIERLVPEDIPYAHDKRWGDGNGFSHVRAAILGASRVIPFANHRLLLGTWQQLVVADFDNHPRSREVYVQLQGE
jgi:secondary thiamine-phosphate synthase enzyme